MKEFSEDNMTIILLSIVFSTCLWVSSNNYGDLGDIIVNKKPDQTPVEKVETRKRYTPPNRGYDPKNAIVHKKVKRWLNGKPAMVNILVINPKQSGVIIKPSNGSYFINSVKSVREIVNIEAALAGINGSYFKPDNGTPLGMSIVDSEIVTGPLYRRVSFGITKDREFKMDKVDITGEVKIGEYLNFRLFNINQPVFSRQPAYTIFTDKWGKNTPKTSEHYSHIVVKHDKIDYIKNSSVPIPKGGYVVVGPHKYVAKMIHKDDVVSYTPKLIPDDWNDTEFAISGGPYLVKEGRIFIDKQKFSRDFLWTKAPRTAIGYTKSGSLVMVTVDGRHKGFSEGATLTELAKIMWELGIYNAMNLDGGTSTQMVVNGKLVNNPSVQGGCRVTNALVIVAPVFAAE